MLQRIPLAVRICTYGAMMVFGILVGLAWLAYQIDGVLPGWHVEIGWLRLVGLALWVGFAVLYVYCSRQLTRRGQGGYIEFDPPSRFVCEGPYRWTRNPVAGCVLGMLLGEAIALSSTGVFLLLLAGLLLAHLQVVLLEEPLLRKRFGQEYEQYLGCVPRWIPRRARTGDPLTNMFKPGEHGR
jgi:protein-S-isoprenylcysteine O-methyltransferase Ste14